MYKNIVACTGGPVDGHPVLVPLVGEAASIGRDTKSQGITHRQTPVTGRGSNTRGPIGTHRAGSRG